MSLSKEERKLMRKCVEEYDCALAKCLDDLDTKDKEIEKLKALNLQFKMAWAMRGDLDAKDNRIKELESTLDLWKEEHLDERD